MLPSAVFNSNCKVKIHQVVCKYNKQMFLKICTYIGIWKEKKMGGICISAKKCVTQKETFTI